MEDHRAHERITLLELAFPKNEDGLPDFAGHCSAHEQFIAESRARTEFWNKLRFELVKWGLLGLLGWLLVKVVWPAFLRGPG